MSPKDQYFTPSDIAIQLVEEVSLRKVHLIADFAAGRGDLFVAARARWPQATYLGSDIDIDLVENLSRTFDNCHTHAGDFLKIRDLKKWIIRKCGGLADLVLLNPPFSVRGRGLVEIQFDKIAYKCSIALAFVTRAIDSLREHGEIVAIIPHGVINSARDASLLEALKHRYKVKIINDNIQNKFSHCQVRCALIKVTKQRSLSTKNQPSDAILCANSVVRGTIDHLVVKLKSRNFSGRNSRVIHTQNLIDGKLNSQVGWIHNNSALTGPGVIIPRVGRLSSGKIVLLEEPTCCLFSKCIIYIAARDLMEARRIHSFIINNWEDFSKCYGGTGAQYTTIQNIKEFLSSAFHSHRKKLSDAEK